MKILIISLPLIFFYALQAKSLDSKNESKSRIDNWLSLTLSNIEDLCIWNGKKSINRTIIDIYDKNYLNFLIPTEGLQVSKYNFIFYHIYNPLLVESMKEFIKAIQNCLTDEDRLDPEEEVEVLGRFLKAHSVKILQLDPVAREDITCFTQVVKKNFEKCQQSTLHIFHNSAIVSKSIFQFLTGIYSTEYSCKDILPLEKCILNAASVCSSNTRKIFHVLLSPPEIGICENFLQEIQPDSDEEIDELFKTKK